MTLSFDSKEDLRIRMEDLERKLAESEEERFKLEKTCNILMRAFREEEKIQYKTLNKNYEKFLQDCTARRRRNDIIMRSLCRIEDRSRALFAKTERLKLLKDRYISYLKITNIKSGISSHIGRTLAPTSLLPKTTSDETPKFVQWRKPFMTDQGLVDLEDGEENYLSNGKSSDVTLHHLVPEEQKVKYRSKDIKTKVFNGISHSKVPAENYDPQNKLYLTKNNMDFPLGNVVMREELNGIINREKPVNWGFLKNDMSSELEIKNLVETPITRVSKDRSHEGLTEKLKNSSSFEDQLINNKSNDEGQDPYNKKVTEESYIKQSEKNSVKKLNSPHYEFFSKINHCTMTSNSSILEEEKQDNDADDIELEVKTVSAEKNLPMGLDGVDYQNETYPESYYEQPVHHHNHTSIVADVILEEDETEQDVNEEEENIFDEGLQFSESKSRGQSPWKEATGHRTDAPFDRPQDCLKNEANNKAESIANALDLNDKDIGDAKSQECHSGKPLEGKSFIVDCSEANIGKSEEFPEENFEMKKNVRSNLIHLLESDSESFQIEHGDAVSGNEDSDFDFSFH